MSAVTTLLAVVQPLAEPAAKAVLHLVQSALAGRDVRAAAEAVATLHGYKATVAAAAELRRNELQSKTRRVSLFTREGNFQAYVHVAGTPRVVLFGGSTYVAFDNHSTTNSFREAEHEEGVS